MGSKKDLEKFELGLMGDEEERLPSNNPGATRRNGQFLGAAFYC